MSVMIHSKRVVCAVQRFNQGSALKRTIFELIAQELLLTLVPDPSAHGAPLAKMDMCVPNMNLHRHA